MQFTTLATLLFAASAIAAPAPAPIAEPTELEMATPELEARGAQALIDVWKNAGFLDLKFTGSANVGDCKNFDDKRKNNLSSGKAKPGFRCTIWVKADCKGDGFSFNASPGASSFPSWIDNKAKSWKCVKA
jgi:hypothetical protein